MKREANSIRNEIQAKRLKKNELDKEIPNLNFELNELAEIN